MAGYIGTKAVNLSTTGADINGNANVDGTLDVTGATTLASADINGDMSFGDNDKAIFGAGSDLQIYHDGSNSYVKDLGAGNLTIQGSSQVNIGGANGTVGVQFVEGANVTLRHNNAPKLSTTSTGVDVTGTITSDGLTVEAGIAQLELIDTGVSGSTKLRTANAQTWLEVDPDNLQASSGFATYIDGKHFFNITDGGDVSFFENTGTTPKFYWSASAESLGLSNAAAGSALVITKGNTTGNALEISNSGESRSLDINHNADGTGTVDDIVRIKNNGTSKFVIDASGNVGIGTASPARGPLHLNATSGSAEMHMTTTGNGTASTDGLTIFAGESVGSAGAGVWYRENGPLRFATNSAERMRIDASGNVLVGQTVVSHTLPGCELLNAGTIRAAASNTYALLLNRISSDGSVASFYRSNTQVGTISVTGSATAYNTSSDYRLKENITPVQGASDIVKMMRPCTYTFKSDGSWHDGFLAHELQELHPRAVVGSKDAMKDEEYEVTPAVYEDITIPAVEAVAEVPAVYDDEGVLVSEMVPAVEAQPERTEQKLVSEAVMGTRSVPDYQGVDYSKLTPILTAALQEALNKIDALEARLTALEATP